MANVTRRPALDVTIDGQIVPRVMSARISKGLTQNYTTAELVLPYPYPAGLRMWSTIGLRAGGSRTSANFRPHFVGHMLDPSLSMWTPRGTLACGTALARAENFYPPITVPLNGLTDVEAINLILDAVGITDRSISGHGKFLGHVVSQALSWGPSTSALAMLQQIDTQLGLGYRTFDTGTTVVRTFVPLSPNGMTATYAFEEGVNCFNATLRRSRVEPAGRVVVNGDGVTSDQEGNPPSNYSLTPYVIQYLMIQQQALDAGIVSAEEMALYLLARLTRVLISVSLTTWVDDVFSPGQIVSMKSAHLLVEQNFYIQQVITSFEGAQFRQQLELISELDERETPSGYQPFGSIDPGTMDPIDPWEPLDPVDFPEVEPPADAVTAAITIMAIDQETVVISGTEQTVYIVYAVDASVGYQSEITTRAWVAAGPVLSGWDTGSGPEFVTAFTTLTGATIALTVTTTGAGTDTVTRDLETAPGVITKTLELFLAAGVRAEAWDPASMSFRVDAQSAAADVEDVANGPFWSLPTTTLNGMWSTDYLATGATEETIAFSGGGTAGVRCWIEPDVDDQAVAVIGSNGELALSLDAGDTWTIKDGPGGNGMDVILSRFVPGQVHVLTDEGYFVSDDSGNSWREIRADVDFKWLVLSHSRNMLVTTGGVLETAEDGTAQTGPSGVLTAAAHIREDRFVALTATNVWRTTTDGGSAMTDLGAITGTPVHMYRHGSIPDFYAYAAGTDGAFKLLIRTNDGPTYDVKVLQIRDPGVGTSHASSSYSRIGVGRMVDPASLDLSVGGIYLLANGAQNVYRRSSGTWSAVTDPAGFNNRADVLTTDDATVVVTDGSAVYRTTDGGTSWTTLTGPVPADPQYEDLAFGEDADTIYVWQGFASNDANAGIWRSANGGSTWSKIIGGADVESGALGGGGLGRGQIHVGASRLYYTVFKDAGGGLDNFVHYADLDGSGIVTMSETWTVGGSVVIRSSAVDGDDNTIYAWELGLSGGVGAGSKLWRVDDSTMTDVTPAAVSITANDYFTSVKGNRNGVVLGIFRKSSTSTIHLYRSTDSGTSWSEVAGLTTAFASADLDITISDSELDKIANNPADLAEWWTAARAANSVLHSTDGGQTWASESVPSLGSNTTLQIVAGGS